MSPAVVVDRAAEWANVCVCMCLYLSLSRSHSIKTKMMGEKAECACVYFSIPVPKTVQFRNQAEGTSLTSLLLYEHSNFIY